MSADFASSVLPDVCFSTQWFLRHMHALSLNSYTSLLSFGKSESLLYNIGTNAFSSSPKSPRPIARPIAPPVALI